LKLLNWWLSEFERRGRWKVETKSSAGCTEKYFYAAEDYLNAPSVMDPGQRIDPVPDRFRQILKMLGGNPDKTGKKLGASSEQKLQH